MRMEREHLSAQHTWAVDGDKAALVALVRLNAVVRIVVVVHHGSGSMLTVKAVRGLLGRPSVRVPWPSCHVMIASPWVGNASACMGSWVPRISPRPLNALGS